MKKQLTKLPLNMQRFKMIMFLSSMVSDNMKREDKWCTISCFNETRPICFLLVFAGAHSDLERNAPQRIL